MPDDSKLERCLRLLEALEERGELATRDAMVVLGVDRQTAMRDLRSLRAAGVPLVPVGYGARRRYRLDSDCRRGSAEVQPGSCDKLALQLGRQVLAFLGVEPAPGAATSPLDRRVVCMGQHPDPLDGAREVRAEILRGLAEDRELRITADGRTWERFQPFVLVLRAEGLVLVGAEPGTSGHQRVALEGVRDVVCLDRRFGLPVEFDLSAVLASLGSPASAG